MNGLTCHEVGFCAFGSGYAVEYLHCYVVVGMTMSVDMG